MRTIHLSLIGAVAVGAAVVGFRPAPVAPAVAAGTISGTVTYTGTPPKMKPIDMAKEPSCNALHAGNPVMTENVVSGPGNTLEWVVVYISQGDQPGAAPTTAAVYTQKGCQYLPHVLPMQAGQPLEIKNDDKTSHNIHPLARMNPEWNKSMPPGAPPIETKYEKPEFIAVKCNIHPWMHGYFAVLGTSHYAVTDKTGKFEITGLAPGKYTVTAWQEKFGTQSQEVTVGASGATANFVFKATPW